MASVRHFWVTRLSLLAATVSSQRHTTSMWSLVSARGELRAYLYHGKMTPHIDCWVVGLPSKCREQCGTIYLLIVGASFMTATSESTATKAFTGVPVLMIPWLPRMIT